jgi:hypothetical protein
MKKSKIELKLKRQSLKILKKLRSYLIISRLNPILKWIPCLILIQRILIFTVEINS